MNHLVMNEEWSLLKKLMMLKVAGGSAGQLVEYTVTGNPATFETNVSKNLKQLLIPFEPVQDLHGQDAPYPPGGGANKWDEEWEVGSYNTSNGNPLFSDTQIRSKNLFPVTPSVQYRVVVDSGAMWAFFYDSNQTLLTDLTIEGVSKSGNAFAVSGKVFTMPSSASYMKFYMTAAYGATYQNDIAVNYPSTVTTYSPYSNLCPISGWTGANVQADGKNLFDPNGDYNLISCYSYSGSAQSRRGKILHLPVGTYYLSVAEKQIGASAFININTINRDGTLAQFQSVVNGANLYNRTFTITSGQTLAIYDQQATTGSSVINFEKFDIQIEPGSVASPYTPYTGTTLPISWQSVAGTVYGGTLDVISGVLTVDSASVDLGTLNWRYNYSSMGVFDSSGIRYAVKSNENCICSIYAKMAQNPTSTGIANAADKTFAVNKSPNGSEYSGYYVAGAILVKDSAYTDATIFKSAMSGVQLVYELAEPIVYQLSPQQLKAFKGVNNIWTDTNGENTIKYLKKE